MATTQYLVNALTLDGTDTIQTTVATKTKKAQAITIAEAHAASEKVAVQVVTAAGTVVLDIAAPRKIRMSPRYSRVQPLPEGVTLPEDADGMRVAYVRPRSNGAVLHDTESGEYRVLDLAKGKLVGRTFKTTRAAGAFVVDGVGAKRRELAQARAAAEAGDATPAQEAELANA